MVPRLRLVLAGVLGLGLVQATVVPPLLTAVAQGLPLPWRLALTGLSLAPLGLLMGAPFPLALRALRADAAPLVPWAWAINGWMSVIASLATVTISRMYGYSAAFGVAMLAYLLALITAGALPTIRPRSAG